MGDIVGWFSDLKHLKQMVKGGYDAVKDTIEGVEHIFQGEPSLVDAQKILTDVKDFLEGAAGLGVDIGTTATRFLESKFGKLAASPIISAAQTAISGMKITTGDGTPVDGENFAKSVKLLEEAVERLIEAEPNGDWDGSASEAYGSRGAEHRHHTSDLGVADAEISKILSREADQVAGTRKTLDDWDGRLSDFDVATAWLNLCGPPGVAAKKSLDLAAAAAALGDTGLSYERLIAQTFENAADVGRQALAYGAIAASEKPVGQVSLSAPFGDESQRPPWRTDPTKPDKRALPDERYPWDPDPTVHPFDSESQTPANPPAAVPGRSSMPGGTPLLPTPAPAAVPPASAPAAVANPPVTVGGGAVTAPGQTAAPAMPSARSAALASVKATPAPTGSVPPVSGGAGVASREAGAAPGAQSGASGSRAPVIARTGEPEEASLTPEARANVPEKPNNPRNSSDEI